MNYGEGYPPQNASSYGYGGATTATTSSSSSDHPSQQPSILRRRHVEESHDTNGTGSYPYNNVDNNKSTRSTPRSIKNVKKLDFMFPKVDMEYTVKTEGGGLTALIALTVIGLLVLAETMSWISQNYQTVEHISVDTSLGVKMQVNMNITFPGLACEDLHVDVMDVAGDSQVDIEDTLIKQRLNKRGQKISIEAEKAESNKHQQREEERKRLLQAELPENYCGPCFGAETEEGQCCNTCDDLLNAYKAKRWRSDVVQMAAEQCIREGRDKPQAKKMRQGEGCNLSGYLKVNRVAGNFHIAMGEGVERDGRHIHTFDPDDTPNFNASHIIHDLSFGPSGVTAGFGTEKQTTTLNGVTKIVTPEHGTTGLFQYFIKVVPTTYIPSDSNAKKIETNGYYFTERFRPLMKEYLPGVEDEGKDEDGRVSVQAGHAHTAKNNHHNVRNAVLPGVFFIYEIYPFAVEIQRKNVPFTHLLIRIMATVGGVFTISKWADALIYSRRSSRTGRR